MKVARFLNGLRGRLMVLPPLLILLATFVPPTPAPPIGMAADSVLVAVPVTLDPYRPELVHAGRLRFQRGWVLRSPDRRFGGISAMAVGGGRVTAISDVGVVLSFPLPDRPGELPLRIEPLPEGQIPDEGLHDTESMWVDGAHAWVGFERIHAIARYRRSGWRLESFARPRSMREWRSNLGAEAMVRLADGRFLLFGEEPGDDERYSPMILFAGDPAVRGAGAVVLRYRRQPGFRVTDAAFLPDGRLLVLNRRYDFFEGPSARLVAIELGDLAAGAVVAGTLIAELRAPLTIDNMEALSVAREGDRTIVRIASDDNFMAFQRSLLLEFVLE
jgi:hypothetical protein